MSLARHGSDTYIWGFYNGRRHDIPEKVEGKYEHIVDALAAADNCSTTVMAVEIGRWVNTNHMIFLGFDNKIASRFYDFGGRYPQATFQCCLSCSWKQLRITH